MLWFPNYLGIILDHVIGLHTQLIKVCLLDFAVAPCELQECKRTLEHTQDFAATACWLGED